MVPSSPAVAARKGRWFLMATALIALVWPAISPAEEPVSNWNTWPNLRTKVYYTLNQLPKKEIILIATISNRYDSFAFTVPR